MADDEYVDEEMEREGWERRSILDEPRLSEVVEAYKELGLEVRVVNYKAENARGCGVCIEGDAQRYKVVYTRG